MRPKHLAAVVLLVLVAGCGSAEERYQKAVQLYETEQTELGRVVRAHEAWLNTPLEEQGDVGWQVYLAIQNDKLDATLQQSYAAVRDKEGDVWEAKIDAQAARVEKARAARDATDKARQ